MRSGRLMGRPSTSPLPWLGFVLLAYLGVPVVAFLIRLGGGGPNGFSDSGLFPALGVSVAGASISTALVAVFGVPLAWVLARSSSRLAAAGTTLVYLPLAVPPLVSGLLLISLAGPYTWLGRLFHQRLTDSLTGVVLAQTFVAAPFLVVTARAAFAALDPSYEEVAATLGHRPLSRFVRVGLPATAWAIRAGLILTWLRAFGEYGATVLLAYHPFSLPVYTYLQFSGRGLADTEAPTALALAVATAAVLALSRPLGRTGRPAPSDPPRSAAAASPTAAPPRAAAPGPPVAFDLDHAVGGFRLRVAHRSASSRLALLGPSGSGKSLTLRSLAGLLGPAAGAVWFGEERVDAKAVESRGVGYVPQGYHLLPHLPAWKQACFGTRADPDAALYWLDTLGVGALRDRRPAQLSGGQRQRVCLAQALASSPRLLLLDEPFSALDAPVRQELGRELRRLQQRSGLSTVFVTHDSEEAALLADEILVLVDGRIVQAGTPADLHRAPATPEVAGLIGMTNLLDGRIGPGGRLHSRNSDLGVPLALPPGPVVWAVHPERVELLPPGASRGDAVPVEIVDSADLGSVVEVELRIAGGPVLRARSSQPGPLPGSTGWSVRFDPEAVSAWPWPNPEPRNG